MSNSYSQLFLLFVIWLSKLVDYGTDIKICLIFISYAWRFHRFISYFKLLHFEIYLNIVRQLFWVS